jgi:hypothetical protein
LTLQRQKTDAEALRLGLIAGYVTVGEVVAWADDVIVADPAPDHSVIEVALAAKRLPADVIRLLGEVLGEVDVRAARRALLGRMLAILTVDPSQGERIAAWLYSLSRHGELPEDEFGCEPRSLDDDFELARAQVYGTIESATERLRDYLRAFSQDPAA